MRIKYIIFFAGVALGIVITLIVSEKFTPPSPTSTSFILTGPGGKGKLEFKVEGKAIDYTKILDNIFSDSDLRAQALGWLGDKQKIFALDSEKLVTSISSDICEPFPEKPLELKIRKKRECADKPVVKGLRDLAFDQKPPFHLVGNMGQMGVPQKSQNKPTDGSANVCKPGQYYGKRLQVGNPVNGEAIEVLASGHYLCTDAANFPDIQLSPGNALKLFPTANLSKLESVVIVPLE